MSDEVSATRAPEPDRRIGTTLDGRYHLLRRLGTGGFGVVYEAEHVLIRRKVAVKMLHAHVAADADLLARFKREAIAATATGHPHIVEVLDMGRAEDGAAYMVLELLAGSDWAATLETEGAQPLGHTVHVVRQVLDALAAAHDKGIVHRDLKPENVFLVPREGEPSFVKIVDFGISKMREESGVRSGAASDVGVTHTGMALGTPASMAPEQFQGKKDVDHRADLWAVGVMLYRALTASWPFGGETYAMLAVSVMTEPPRPLRELRPDVPEGVATIVSRLLEKDRERRFQSAREVRAALEPYEKDTQPAPSRASMERMGLAETAIATAIDSRPRGAVTGGDGAPTDVARTRTTSGIEATSAGAAALPRSRAPIIAGAAVVAVLVVALGALALTGGEPATTTGLPTSVAAEADAGAPATASVGEPDAGAEAAIGHLVLWTTPSCMVSREGEPLGFTPLSVDLPVGTHVLLLENPSEDVHTTHEVTIEAGETTRDVVDLTLPTPAPGERRPRPPTHADVVESETEEPTTAPAETPTTAHETPPAETPPVEAPEEEAGRGGRPLRRPH